MDATTPPPATDKGPAQSKVTENWKELLYTPDRMKAWINGEITLQQLHGISGPEMLEMAVSGFAMYEQGRYKEARVIFEGLTSLDSSESYYHTALGAIHLAQDQLDDAIKEFDEAIKINQKDLAAYVNRGEVRLRKGLVLEAAEDFKHAVDLDPENKDPLALRARALAAAALETLEKGSGGKGGKDAEPKRSSAKKPEPKKGGKRK